MPALMDSEVPDRAPELSALRTPREMRPNGGRELRWLVVVVSFGPVLGAGASLRDGAAR